MQEKHGERVLKKKNKNTKLLLIRLKIKIISTNFNFKSDIFRYTLYFRTKKDIIINILKGM